MKYLTGFIIGATTVLAASLLARHLRQLSVGVLTGVLRIVAAIRRWMGEQREFWEDSWAEARHRRRQRTGRQEEEISIAPPPGVSTH